MVMFKFLKGASAQPAPSGFKGYTTVGALTFVRAFSDTVTPVQEQKSMYPIHRRKRGR